MAKAVQDIDHGWEYIKQQTKKAQGAGVKIGILESAGKAIEKDKNGIEKQSDATVAEVAFFNEFGTKRGIPERPFIRATADDNREKYTKAIKKQMSDILQGKSNIERSLGRIGEAAKADVKKKIKTVRTPPNAAATIKAKGSSNPLIDTGHMQGKVDYEVMKGKKA